MDTQRLRERAAAVASLPSTHDRRALDDVAWIRTLRDAVGVDADISPRAVALALSAPGDRPVAKEKDER